MRGIAGVLAIMLCTACTKTITPSHLGLSGSSADMQRFVAKVGANYPALQVSLHRTAAGMAEADMELAPGRSLHDYPDLLAAAGGLKLTCTSQRTTWTAQIG
jgi:hypothetical protein